MKKNSLCVLIICIFFICGCKSPTNDSNATNNINVECEENNYIGKWDSMVSEKEGMKIDITTDRIKGIYSYRNGSGYDILYFEGNNPSFDKQKGIHVFLKYGENKDNLDRTCELEGWFKNKEKSILQVYFSKCTIEGNFSEKYYKVTKNYYW